MKIKKTLAGIVLGVASILPMAKADPITYQVPVQSNIDFQNYLDMAQDGDRFNFYKPNNMWAVPGFVGNFHTNKSITIDGNGLGLFTDNYGTPGFTINNNGNVRFEDMFFSGRGREISVKTTENSNADFYDSSFSTAQNAINHNSTGNLSVNDCYFNEAQSIFTKSINLEKIVGDILITQNTIAYSNVGIYLGQDLSSIASHSSINILNNTIHSTQKSAIELSSLLTHTTGKIANNSLSKGDKGIVNPQYRGDVKITNNNLYDFNDNFDGDFIPNQEINYFEDPEYNNRINLLNKGLYIEGVTTWFPNENHTWIGKSKVIPEPLTLALLSLGLGSLISLKRKH